jgi:hypothetical protein
MKKALKRLGEAAADLYRRYPARGNSYILAGVVAVCGAVGVAIDAQSAASVIALVAPILIGGELTHRKVSPAR